MAALPNPILSATSSLVHDVQPPDIIPNCYALDARYSNSNPQSFAATYKKAKQLLLQSGVYLTVRPTSRHVTNERRCKD